MPSAYDPLRLLAVLLTVALPATAASQQQTVTGRVLSVGENRPVAGAVVQVAGGTGRALSDQAGAFTVQVPALDARLLVSAVGFSADTVPLAGRRTVTVLLRATAVQLEGVVAIGYGTQEKRDVTGAIASVDQATIRQIPTPNAIDAIKGRVPGVDIVATGYAPGEGVEVRIRGTRSIRAGNDPLYVVDGVPLSGGIEDFNPQSIQSIEVLKDASATAIYGARGANGVVLITTTQGRRGETRIRYETYAGMQHILNKVPMMNGEEFANHKRESYRAAGQYTTDEDLFYDVELESLRLGRSTDWQDEVLRTGYQQSHQLGADGGDDDTRYSVNVNHFDQTGVTRGQDYLRQTAGFNLDQIAGRLRFGVSTQISRSVQNLSRGDGIWGEALRANPLGPARDSAGNVIFLPTPDGLASNPLSDIANWKHENTRTRVFGSLFSELKLAEGVSWRVNLGPDLSFSRTGIFRGSETNPRRLSPADASVDRGESFAYTLDNVLSVDRDIGVDHDVGATLLYSIQQERSEGNRGEVGNLPYEHQSFYNLGTGAIIEGVGSELREWSLQSYMGRLNYGYLDRYLFTVTARIDGSSRLAPGNKYALFPSVAVGWRLADEPFVRDLGFFSELKLRASYGRTGNTAIDPYQTQGALRRTVYMLGDQGAFGYEPDQLQNAELEWEKTSQLDVGVDFGVLDDRISGTVDFYRARTSDLLLLRQLPSATGFSSILQNVGETQNAGVELALSTLNLDDWHGLRWTTDFNVSANRNKILSLYGGRDDDVGNRWFIGEPISVFYDYKFDGIWQLEEEAEAARYRQVPGQIRVVDRNADGKIDDQDRTILGSSYPEWTGSISSRLEWKNVDLAMLATARHGGTIFDEFGHNYNLLYGRYNNLRVDYWTPTSQSRTQMGPNAFHVARPLYGESRAYRDGSHARIRNVTLGYTVPASLAGRWGGESLRVYASAQDPFVFTDYVGFDPESGTGNGAPSYRTLLIGASVGF